MVSLGKSDKEEDRTYQVAYADDLAEGGKVLNLRSWWDKLLEKGPPLGYFPKASKSWLIVKEDKLEEAKELFRGTEIKISSVGKRYLGGFIGKESARNDYFKDLVDDFVSQIDTLSNIACSQPQAAYSAFIHGFQHKLTYHIRTIPSVSDLLLPLDEIISNKLIPALTDGYVCSDAERSLLSLPVKLGGLGIPIFSTISDREFNNSKIASKQLTRNILNQISHLEFDINAFNKTRNDISSKRFGDHKILLGNLRETMSKDQLRANDLAQKKGASSWLSCLPLKRENFCLNKREFYDGVRMRYRWSPKYMPGTCVCGKRFDVDHGLSCQKGGFIYRRHDEVKELIGHIANELYHDVEIEPNLIPISGEMLHHTANRQQDARLDISIRDFWQRGQRAFADVRIFNPFAQTHLNQKLENCFSNNEKEKKKSYGQRVIDVEHGSFTPLIFSSHGGYGREADRFLSVLAEKLAIKKDISYGETVAWLRTKISFCLLRSAILCVRGSRSVRKVITVDTDNIELTCSEGRIE